MRKGHALAQFGSPSLCRAKLIQQVGLTEEVDLESRGNTIVIAGRPASRVGWAEAAAQLHAEGGDQLLDPPPPTRFDETDWQW